MYIIKKHMDEIVLNSNTFDGYQVLQSSEWAVSHLAFGVLTSAQLV
jgi:hypothetical protein